MRIRCLPLLLLPALSVLHGQSAPAAPRSSSENPGQKIFLKVRLDSSLKTAKLQPGDAIHGELARDVYAGDHELFAGHSKVELTVERMERRRRIPDDHWPWVVKAFTPRHENYPAMLSAKIVRPDGTEAALGVEWFATRREREVIAPVAGGKTAKTKQKPLSENVATLEASAPDSAVASTRENAGGAQAVPPIGAEGKVVLLGDLSAGQNHRGDEFQARLIEPVWVHGNVLLPEGTVLSGKISKLVPPRWLSRPGSLYLNFTSFQIPGGEVQATSAAVTAAQLDQRSHTKIDREGQLRGERPGKMWMLINGGVTAGIAKEVDDGTQLILEALISTATDASTAGTARIVSTCASGIFMITRHGRDVVLPRFTEMNIVFDRPGTAPEHNSAR